MEITEEMVAAVSPVNVRRPVDEFAAVWRIAESECLRLCLSTPIGQTAWELSYASAAMGTFRWLAGAEVEMGPPFAPIYSPARAPLLPYSGIPLGDADLATIREAREEAQRLLILCPEGYKTPGMPPRPGYLEGVRDTIDWAHLHGPTPRLGAHRSEEPAPAQ